MMTEDEFDPLPADMMRARRERGATTYERAWGLPAQRIRPLVGDSTADLAVIARIGGNLYREHVVAQVTSMDRCIEVDLANRDPFVHEVMVPESALSWPVYRAAMSGLYGGEDDPLSKPPDEPPSESELRALHGDR